MSRQHHIFCRTFGAIAICTLLQVHPAIAGTLQWSDGKGDVTLAEAGACTLVVDRAAVVGHAWRIRYTSSEPGLRFVITDLTGKGGRLLDPCRVGKAEEPADRTARRDSIEFCATTDDKASPSYIVRGGPGVRATLELCVATADGNYVGISSITINRGSDSPLPPVLASATRERHGTDVVFRLSGIDLDRLRSAVFRVVSSGRIDSLEIVSASNLSVVAKLSHPAPLPRGVIEVASQDGSGDAFEVAEESLKERPRWYPGRIVLKLRPHVVVAVGAGDLGAIRFSSPDIENSLRLAGVRRMQPLYLKRQEPDSGAKTIEGESTALASLSDVYVADLQSEEGVDAACSVLKGQRAVLYVHPDYFVEGATTPNDSLYGKQWALHTTAAGAVCGLTPSSLINASLQTAWDITTGTSGTIVGVVDTGIDPLHPDLRDRVMGGHNFIDAFQPEAWQDNAPGRHGTAVAGIIGANASNGTGIAGIDWAAKLVSLKALDGEGQGTTSAVASAIDWATSSGYPILNLSLSGQAQSAALAEACLNARSRGMLLVAAAGNVLTAGGEDQVGPEYPAAYAQRVVAVGAIMPTNGARWRDVNLAPSYCSSPNPGNPCRASNWGDWLDLEAPGGRFIVSTKGGGSGNYYDLASCSVVNLSNTGFGGTSAATPVVAGVASLLKGYRPELNGDDLEQVLKLGALNLVNPPYDQEHGWGFVRAKASLDLISPPNVIAHWSVGNGLSFPTGSFTAIDSTPVQVNFIGVPEMPADSQYSCMRYQLRATAAFKFSFSQTPRAWVQCANARGRRDSSTIDYTYDGPFARLISANTSSAIVETFVYRVIGVGWYPNPPIEACVGLTVIGTPATNAVSGKEATFLGCGLSVSPSPGHHRVSFRLKSLAPGRVRAQILDAMGRVVAVVLDQNLERGEQSIEWAGAVPSGRAEPGVYFLCADANGVRTTKRFVWLGL